MLDYESYDNMYRDNIHNIQLESFQTFKSGYTNYTYTDYKSEPLDTYQYTESDPYNAYFNKPVTSWTRDDVLEWLMQSAKLSGINDFELPIAQFEKIDGLQLINLDKKSLYYMFICHDRENSHRAEDNTEKIYRALQQLIEMADPNYWYQNHETQLTDLDRISEETTKKCFTYDPYEKNRMQTAEYYDPNWSLVDGDRMENGSSSDISTGSNPYNEDMMKRSKRPPGRPRGTGRKLDRKNKNVSVPEFLIELLHNPNTCPTLIKWEDYNAGKFRFMKPDKVAELWGRRKNNGKMSFEKFSRAMRYHYRGQVLQAVPSARLVYQFGSKAPHYFTDNPNFEK